MPVLKYHAGMIVLQPAADAGGAELGGRQSAANEYSRARALRQAVELGAMLLVQDGGSCLPAQLNPLCHPATFEKTVREDNLARPVGRSLAARPPILNLRVAGATKAFVVAEQQVTRRKLKYRHSNNVWFNWQHGDQETDRLRDWRRLAARGNLPQYKLARGNGISELVRAPGR